MVGHGTELGGDERLVAAIVEGRAQQALIGAEAVELGGVEVVDAEVQRLVQQLDGVGFVHRLAIGDRHAHAAQADSIHVPAGAADLATDHGQLPR